MESSDALEVLSPVLSIADIGLKNLLIVLNFKDGPRSTSSYVSGAFDANQKYKYLG